MASGQKTDTGLTKTGLEWIWRVGTLLVIPALGWIYMQADRITVLEQRCTVREERLAELQSDLKSFVSEVRADRETQSKVVTALGQTVVHVETTVTLMKDRLAELIELLTPRRR